MAIDMKNTAFLAILLSGITSAGTAGAAPLPASSGQVDELAGKNTAVVATKRSPHDGNRAKSSSLIATKQVAQKPNRRKKPSASADLFLPAALDTGTALRDGKAFGFDKIVFVKRYTYSANHYYTEFINSRWTPGGNLCVLDLKSGKVTDLVPELEGGVFERFDLDFDARHIVFAWKKGAQDGYRIYEVGIDPKTGARKGALRQVTFPEDPQRQPALAGKVEQHQGHDDGQHALPR